MPTLILSPRQTDDGQCLWRVAIARGWDVQRLRTWRIDEAVLGADDPFLYVEALFGATLAEQLGVTLLNPREDWLSSLPERYSRRKVVFSTLAEARKASAPAFVKPPNDKSFPAAVYSPGELPAAFDGEMSVLISEPVTFVSEFRCFVLERKVQTFSLYARHGLPTSEATSPDAESAHMLSFVSQVLQDHEVDIPRACVLDCGLIDGRGWAVIEPNAAWGAGIYGCDPDKAIDVVRAATVRAAPIPRS
ncbi:MAG TPA: ATP-grasp domain-containing protein [Polyangiaceae bacterium]|nr:ATP-grasp domain-containing protein [Polyangiaceae bacterium]